MTLLKKAAGLVAGVSAVAVLGVAVAQGVPPNPFVSNPALGAGQQSTHLTSMGETGVPGMEQQVQAAQVPAPEPVAVQQPAPVVAEAPAPAPVPMPAPAVERQQMGAGPAPAPAEPPAQVQPERVARADRN